MTKHILFVDDEVPLRVTLSLYFKLKGFSVTAAENSQHALKLVRAGDFGAVILDIGMGNENGLDLLDLLKQEFPELPVVMFTSLASDPAAVSLALSKGARAVFCKSESMGRLLQGVVDVTG